MDSLLLLDGSPRGERSNSAKMLARVAQGWERGGGGEVRRLLLGVWRQGMLGDPTARAFLPSVVVDLAATERYTHAGALDHRTAGGLHGRKPAAAVRALPAAADGRAVIGHPAVHNAGVRIAAKWTVHGVPSLDVFRCRCFRPRQTSPPLSLRLHVAE